MAFKRRAASEALSMLSNRRSSRHLRDDSAPNAPSAARIGRRSSVTQINRSRTGPYEGAERKADTGKARRRSWRISDSLRMSGSKKQASLIRQAGDAFGRGGWTRHWSQSAGAANHAELHLHRCTAASSRPAAASFTRSARRAGFIREAVSSLFGRPSTRHPIKRQGSKSSRDENLRSEGKGSGARSLHHSMAGTHARSRRGPVAFKGDCVAGTSALSAILPHAFSPSPDEEGGRSSNGTGGCSFRCCCCRCRASWPVKEPAHAAIQGAADWIRKEDQAATSDLEATPSRQCLRMRSVADTAQTTAVLQGGARPSRFRVWLDLIAFSKIRFENQPHHLHEHPPSQLDKAAARAQRSTASAAAIAGYTAFNFRQRILPPSLSGLFRRRIPVYLPPFNTIHLSTCPVTVLLSPLQPTRAAPAASLSRTGSGHRNRPATNQACPHASPFVGVSPAFNGSNAKPFEPAVLSNHHPAAARSPSPFSRSSDLLCQPHPYGVWHRNQQSPTSLPVPPKRPASASLVRHDVEPHSSLRKHNRYIHSLGASPDLSSATVSSRLSSVTQRSSLGYADVRASGFPFIMPDSGSEATNTPASELASDRGSLCPLTARSDGGSVTMTRSYSDRPSMRSYEESSVSAKGPGATINRTAGEHLGSTLREHFTPSPMPPTFTSHHQHDVVPAEQRRSTSVNGESTSCDKPSADHDADSRLRPASSASRNVSPAAASLDTASSPIMKMRPASTTTPSLRDFPVNTDLNPSFESVHAPVRQRTDSRPTISPTNTSRAISTPAPMPVPLALQDHRPTVRRAQGQRAESEVVRSRSSSKPFSFPSRASVQYTARERGDVLQNRSSQAKSGGSFIRRLIRRASLKGKRSQSVGGSASSVLSPGKTSIALPTELEIEDASENASTPRAESSTSKSSSKDTKPRRNSLVRRRSKSKDQSSANGSKSSSFFAPFLARDPAKLNGKFRTQREDSFGHLGPLPLDDGPPFPKDGLPFSSSAPILPRDLDFSQANAVKSRDYADKERTEQTVSSSDDSNEATELLDSPQMKQAADLGTPTLDDDAQRRLSHMTDQTENSMGMGMALTTRNNFDFQDSLGLNELAAAGRQRPGTIGSDSHSSRAGPALPSSNGHSNITESHSRPRPGIPRMWQGIESIDGDHTVRSTHIDDAEDSDDASPERSLPANRFDTATTTSSFKTAVSNLDSPRSNSTRRLNVGSRASRVSLRTLDTPLARHFDQAGRQDSPLADLITNLERRLSIPSTAGTMRSTPYHDTAASPGSEFLQLEPEQTLPAIAAGPSPPPSLGHHDLDDEDDEGSIRAFPHQAHPSAASHTALVETMGHSNRNSYADPTSPTTPGTFGTKDGEQHWYKRDTFGGLDSIPMTAETLRSVEPVSSATRPQLSRFSTATMGGEDDYHQAGDSREGDQEQQEVILPEVKVSEIESHLAAVEAALQDNRDEGSFDPTSLRQRMSDASYATHPNLSSASMLSREPSQQPAPRTADKSTDDLSLPGAWTQDSSSFIMSDDGRRITLAPESHEALADAVRSVRKAISSSQLTDADESHTAIASRSVDTLGMESFVSDAAEPAGERTLAGDMSMLSEATPGRAARRRQEGIRDIEEAYNRMLALVQSTAIGVTPSPQMRSDEARLGVEPPRRPNKAGIPNNTTTEPFFTSPLAKASTKTDEPLSQAAQSKRTAFDGGMVQQPGRTHVRAQAPADHRTSTSLSGLMGMPLDVNPQMLRHGSVSSVASVADNSIRDSIDGAAVRKRPPSDAKSSSSRYSQAFSRDHAASSLIESDSFRKRFSSDNTTVGRASSGGGHTSPSATAKTLGTPRSFATSISQHSLANMVRRHELEKESLLDTLERVRAENADMHARHDSLTSDLHAEVTRVLELERELERRDSREVTLIGQIQDLENELMELRYLDHQLNASADQTLGSEDGEGSILDVELPPTLHTSTGMGISAFSPRRSAAGSASPAPSSVMSAAAAAAKPTHRSTRSEAFVSGLPGSERATLPSSRSELPRARPVSLLNGPGGLFREDRSDRGSQASPLPTPRSSSLLRSSHRAQARSGRGKDASPTLLGLSLPKDEDEAWNIADEQLPEIDDEPNDPAVATRPRRGPSSSENVDGIESSLGTQRGHEPHDETDDDRNSSRPSTITVKRTAAVANGTEALERDSSTSSMPRSSSQVTVTKNAVSQLPRASVRASKIPTSRSVSGISESPSNRSVSSRLPRLGLKPSANYANAGGIRSVSGATDKSTASTLSSVYSTMSSGAPPSLGSLQSGNNTMEDEIQAELARLGNPQPYMRYYSPPRSKMI
ncbi:hypothetical protein PANT_9c00352 [Moesziomyces antarcticus T-34]|uniref:Uncharacterized protein n=1 Tax=Pseudozyma antarctica (strain T-34) TaxID=1151754 RepID=M9MEZ2_PSEA3|nr:hypothetical protein PANT_9c00352 [Moesziomyces antarcticus T-34]